MAKKPDQKLPAQKTAPRIRDSKFVTIYSNNVGIMTTNYDIQLLFAYAHPGPDGLPIVLDQVLVAMSPAHAKAMLTVFDKNLKDWENIHGRIELKEAPVKQLITQGKLSSGSVIS